MSYPYDFQLGSTVGTMRNLYRWAIPYPASWPFVPYTRVEKRGDGTEAGYGFASCSWGWGTLSQAQLYRLLRFLGDIDDDASAIVYIITYRDSQAVLEPVTWKAIMHRPLDDQGKTLVPGSSPNGGNYTDVTIRFSHLETP